MKLVVAGGAMALMLASALASADDVETVRTKNGSVYRGELVEKVVDDHITLKLVTGEIKRIEWDDADFSLPDGHASSAPSPPRRQPDGGVNVTLEADNERATLQILRGTGTVDVDYVNGMGATVYTAQRDIDLYSNVCGVGPCENKLDPRGRYRVGGPDLIPTESFTLRPGVQNTVHASMASVGRRNAGRWLTILGTSATVIGGLFLAIAPLVSDTPACDGCVRFQSSCYLWAGIVGGIGLGLLIPGIVLWAGASSTAKINLVGKASHPARYALGLDGLHF